MAFYEDNAEEKQDLTPAEEVIVEEANESLETVKPARAKGKKQKVPERLRQPLVNLKKLLGLLLEKWLSKRLLFCRLHLCFCLL